MMPRFEDLPDIVRDASIETEFLDDHTTKHVRYKARNSARHRRLRKEVGIPKKLLARRRSAFYAKVEGFGERIELSSIARFGDIKTICFRCRKTVR